MIDYSNPTLLALRRVGQQLGILRPMVRLYRRTMGTAYEEGFDNSMLALVKPGQVVWDIGANIGLFTAKFSERVGDSGRVIAFEPSPNTFETLKKNTARSNVTTVNAALADFSGKASFAVSGETDDPTNSLVKSDEGRISPDKVVDIDVFRASDYIRAHPEHFPNLIKIDVEGFEDDVVAGGSEVLADKRLQFVCIEIHFLELAKRGRAGGSTKITDSLKAAGFSIKWTDPSHIVAQR